MESFFRSYAPQLQVIYDRMPISVQNVMTTTRGWFLQRNRYSSDMFTTLRELRSHESWNAEQIATYQLEGTRRIVEHARKTVPFYRDYSQLPWNSVDDVTRYPVLSRDTVRENSALLVSQSPNGQLIRVSTTGTTGASLGVTYTLTVARRNYAFRMRQFAWAGIQPRDARVTLFGSRVIPPDRDRRPYWTHNLLEHQVLMSIFHLSERSAPDYIAFLRLHRGEVLEGFPSVLAILADFILQEGVPVPMRVVFTDGEPLYPFLREKIEQAFQSRVYDSYGNTELCGLIQECEERQMHLIPEYAYLEILDHNNQPVASGDEGYFVWTGLVNDTMPLIRYRIGDRGCWQDLGPCPCGRNFPVVVPTITRASDLLRCSDGRIFSPRALNQTLKGTGAFRFCQFVQDQPGRVILRAVASNGNAPAELAIIRERLQKVLGKQMRVSAALAYAPLTRAGGKIPLIVQQVESWK
jgi:phenylacetate-CoA ligase